MPMSCPASRRRVRWPDRSCRWWPLPSAPTSCLAAPGSRPGRGGSLAARTLVKGEALAPPAGRADDYVWPRREIGREQAKGDTPVAAASLSGTVRQCPDRSSFCRRSKRYNNRRGSCRRRCRSGRRKTNAPSLRDFFGGVRRGAASARAACGRTAAGPPLRAGRVSRVTSDDRPKSRRAPRDDLSLCLRSHLPRFRRCVDCIAGRFNTTA